MWNLIKDINTMKKRRSVVDTASRGMMRSRTIENKRTLVLYESYVSILTPSWEFKLDLRTVCNGLNISDTKKTEISKVNMDHDIGLNIPDFFITIQSLKNMIAKTVPS